jgi:hypothetical protein
MKIKIVAPYLLALLIVIATIHIINYLNIKEREDSIIVGKKFACALLENDIDRMNNWASKELKQKIEKERLKNIDKSSVFNNYHLYDYLELITYKQFGSRRICTYASDSPIPLFCTVVLEPCYMPTYLEQITMFFHQFPLTKEIIGSSSNKARWCVDDFYTNSDFPKYVASEEIKQRNINGLSRELSNQYYDEWSRITDKNRNTISDEMLWGRITSIECDWSKREMFIQHNAAESLFYQYPLIRIEKEFKLKEDALLNKYIARNNKDSLDNKIR